MELDKYRPGYIIYADRHVLMTSDGTTTHLIAENSAQGEYREGVGAVARFNRMGGFTQISEKLVVLADSGDLCMILIDRTSHTTSAFSGKCHARGYQDGRPGQFNLPESVVIDKRDKNQLLIVDRGNAAVRTVNVVSLAAGTFVKSDSLDTMRGITQDEKSGDFYITALDSVYRITYTQKTVSLISGSPGRNSHGYRDSTLLDSQFRYPAGLIFITPRTLLVADFWNYKLRLVDMKSDKVTTLNVTNSLSGPFSLLLTNNSLYVGHMDSIVQYKCE